MLLCFRRYFSQGNPVLCLGSDSSVQSGATSIPHPNSPMLAATINLYWTDPYSGPPHTVGPLWEFHDSVIAAQSNQSTLVCRQFRHTRVCVQ